MSDHFCDIPLEYEGLPISLESSNFWRSFSTYCKDIFEKNGFDSPSRQRLKILVVYGGAGGLTLNLVKHINNADFYHTDSNGEILAPFNAILNGKFITWEQRTEGVIHDKCYFWTEEPLANTLKKNNNSLTSMLVDYSNLPETLSGFDIIIGEFKSFDKVTDFLKVKEKLKREDSLIIAATCKGFLEKTLVGGNFISRESANHLILETNNKRQYIPSEFSYAKVETLRSTFEEETGNDSTDQQSSDYYERKDILDSYREFHFQKGPFGFGNFPENMAIFCLEMAKKFNINLESCRFNFDLF